MPSETTPTDLHASARELLAQHISSKKGMRNTPERNAILDVVLEMKGHHSADEVLAMMPAKFHVSRVTVYSTLQLLDEIGILWSHQLNGVTLYENAFGVEEHQHTICLGCGKISDLVGTKLEERVMQTKTPRFKKIACSVYLYGYCNICQAKINRARRKEEFLRLSNLTREERRFRRIGLELAACAEDIFGNKDKNQNRKSKNES